jgi:transcriptional regulator with XRE-family HTH domain
MQDNAQLTSPFDDMRPDSDERFAVCLKRIRIALDTKQLFLSRAIGCSDAAVSLWESGARVPNPRSLGPLLAALAAAGASTSELLELRRVWVNEFACRRTGRRLVGELGFKLGTR